MINGNYRSIVQFGIGVMLREQMLERNYEKISFRLLSTPQSLLPYRYKKPYK
jgi:hypothetical protein